MRLVAAGLLVTAMLAVPLGPAASACSIHVHDPTDPGFSDDCRNPENWTEDQGTVLVTTANATSQWVGEALGVCEAETRVCTEALTTQIWLNRTSDASAELELNVTVSDFEPLEQLEQDCIERERSGDIHMRAAVC